MSAAPCLQQKGQQQQVQHSTSCPGCGSSARCMFVAPSSCSIFCRCRYENDPKYKEAKEELAEAKDALKRKEEEKLILLERLKGLEEDRRRGSGKSLRQGCNARCARLCS